MPWDFMVYLISEDVFDLINGQRDNERNISNFAISTVPADGPAPLGARSSAGTVMTKFGSCISTAAALEWLPTMCTVLSADVIGQSINRCGVA